MASAASQIIRRGSCLCRRVQFTLTGPPARNIICHCLNCQKTSGSAFLTNILYKRDQYAVTAGQDGIKVYTDTDVESGGTLERAFCRDCGSNLTIRNVSNPKMAGNVVVAAGSVEDAFKEFVPQSELFKHRRHGWVPEVKRDKTAKI